jgi:hypothetical protein
MSNFITSLDVVAGAPESSGPSGNHIVVYDQSGKPLSSADLGVTYSSSVLPDVDVVRDATGFFFIASPAAPTTETGPVTFTYTPNGITAILTITISSQGVTALQLSRE